MKIYKYKKVKLIFSEKNKYYFKEKRVFGTEVVFTDLKGEKYQLFTQDKIEYFSNYRVNNPKIGIIVKNNIFVPFSNIENILRSKNTIEKKFNSENIDQLYEKMIKNKSEVKNEKIRKIEAP
jgi:hypothetical protein